MPWYSLNTAPIINYMQILKPTVQQVWLADDAAAGGKIPELHSWYENLEKEGKKSGYYVNSSKTESSFDSSSILIFSCFKPFNPRRS